jgi:demethylmenaquinone methyltransferase/2-methoxy-6-polyprenyl-1,4-benzoquinol methylase
MSRRAGLQKKWAYVVNSLQEIVPSYELASSRISLYADKRMRAETVGFAVTANALVLDLGCGPGTLSKEVKRFGGKPVLIDVSRHMLSAAPFNDRIQGSFEYLPFCDGVFDAVVSGFAVRDALDLHATLLQIRRVLKRNGRFAFCDLGKPSSQVKAMLIAFYIKTIPPILGLATAGRAGLRYGSLYDTYLLVLNNSELTSTLSTVFRTARIHETQLGGSIVAKCIR